MYFAARISLWVFAMCVGIIPLMRDSGLHFFEFESLRWLFDRVNDAGYFSKWFYLSFAVCGISVMSGLVYSVGRLQPQEKGSFSGAIHIGIVFIGMVLFVSAAVSIYEYSSPLEIVPKGGGFERAYLFVILSCLAALLFELLLAADETHDKMAR